MNIVQAEENLKKITTKYSKESFIFDLMWAYDFPKATISRLQKGSLDKAKNENEVVLKKKFYFISTSKKDLDSIFEKAIKDNSILKHDPRFIIVTDNQSLKAYDTKVGEKLDTEIKTLSKHPDFFLPWAGIEKKVFQGENPADVKAAEKLAKFFDLILQDNIKLVEKNRHALNVFLTRILFCFFAEDTEIFEKDLFTKSINDHTNKDGNDVADYLKRLFEVLNKKSRAGLPDYLKEFPYVNGGLFAEEFPIPNFSKRSRESLIDLGSDLNWAEINPDIFGSMIQAVVHPDQRAGLGMHYTSVTNIMKVIEPLFLSELKEEFEKAKSSKPKLKKLHERINNIKIFDPACGSGNFLIIAYKELRFLEIQILKELGGFTISSIPLSNFYGIEIDDFAHEVAKLSLWLAEHQMDVQFNKEFGNVKASLPLKDSGKIICANSARIDWSKFISPDKSNEIYILGNPPYAGARKQSVVQKEDLEIVFSDYDDFRNLDYISLFFYKGALFCRNHNAKLAFVSTNSICQGEQVELLWPKLFNAEMEVSFAQNSFKWSNNARDKAAVICIIVGLSKLSQTKNKKIFFDNYFKNVQNINGYLIEGDNSIIEKRRIPISGLPEMPKGNMPYDGGNLILSTSEKNKLLKDYPISKKFIKRLYGSKEFIQGEDRWCLWIKNENLEEAMLIPEIASRINNVKKLRMESTDDGAKKLASRPHQFRETNETLKSSLIIPSVSSENRDYIPIGFVDKNTIVTNLAFVIYEADTYLFGILSSRMHMAWVRVVAGRLKSDYRYSSHLCYNTFPFPKIHEDAKNNLEKLSLKIIHIREKHSGLNLSDLYSPNKMPEELLNAHLELDDYVDSLFSSKGFKSDYERVECLFDRYIKITKEE